MLVRPPPAPPSFHGPVPGQYSPGLGVPAPAVPPLAADVSMTISGSGASHHWPDFLSVQPVDRCGVGAASDTDGATRHGGSGGSCVGGGGNSGGGSGGSNGCVGVGAEANDRTRHSSRGDCSSINSGGIGADGGCGEVSGLDIAGSGHSDVAWTSGGGGSNGSRDSPAQAAVVPPHSCSMN
ncbi:hypothetical protein RRG08_011809 [Elysia crispata]|uniref:Uncharacterized protein n=1 Tax=Elysia crispata TaxID=231223 RepID=A0AAE1AH54_9GAST|nr:hypothetical protein RRG08_011809 [Elysia crispata]